MLTLEIAIGFFGIGFFTISLIEAGAAVKLKKQMNVPLLLIELKNLFCPWLSWLWILPFLLSFLAYLSGKQVILEQQEDILVFITYRALLDSMLSFAFHLPDIPFGNQTRFGDSFRKGSFSFDLELLSFPAIALSEGPFNTLTIGCRISVWLEPKGDSKGIREEKRQRKQRNL